MSASVKTVYLAAPGDITLKDVPYPQKADDQVLIKVESVGICGSDIGAYRGVNPLVTYPRVIGHEVVGTVIEGGVGMPAGIAVGDRVIVDPYINCGHCYPCSIGRTNCCEHLKVIGVHVEGGMSEVFAHPARLLHRVPPGIPLEAIPLAEPLTIALHAMHRTGLKSGEHIVIIGAGAIGLLCALASLSYGAVPILVDILDERLTHAQTHGVPHVINPRHEDAVAAVKRITQGRMAEVVVEASGSNIAIQDTLRYVSFAGRIALTGWPKNETPLPTNLITLKEVNVRGSRTSVREFAEALKMIADGVVPASAVISKAISMEEIPAAVVELAQFPERHLKINAVL
ncbi:MAG: alcohol dehydrogenase catalytic domain-containing protein [Rhodocyclaceae bacterium]